MSDALRQWEFVERAAREQGVGDEALRKWRERGRVPHRWRLPLLEQAKRERFRLDAALFDDVPRNGHEAA